ncbi:magnesium transporter NIPA-domain-containing protein [Pisolithus thermaeus]|nr:magnesium transporter NIPA-domain-containing protein [Pisolithus thermaeus]
MSSTTTESATSTATGMASSTASSTSTSFQLPSSLKVIGIILAITSGLLIGSSFVFKKKGLLRSQAGRTAGEGVAYLKSPLWWTGMIMMILGEICNFAAYAFVEALVVTPMGALSVVICAILSSIFLKEKLTFFGWMGCALCIIGSVIIALNGPQESTPSQISTFKTLFLAPGFLAYIGVLVTVALSIIIYFGPRYGKRNMLWYLAVCSTIGGISVSVTTGLGAAIVSTAMGDNQFNNWFIFFLIGFVAVTLVTEVYYLNVALALFNTAMVTPTYYVLFSFCSMVTTIVLFQGLAAPVSQILTLVFAFLTICVGITILQMSKIDPAQLSSLDRRSTLLLQVARAHTENAATFAYSGTDNDAEAGEKTLIATEDPGIDALRGSFGTVGSILRARSSRRLSQSSRGGSSARGAGRGLGVGGGMVGSMDSVPFSSLHHTDRGYDGLTRHQLYDAPVQSTTSLHGPRSDSADRASSFSSTKSPRPTVIKFDSQDVVHSYTPPRSGDASGATHSAVRLAAAHSSGSADSKTGTLSYQYPPTSPVPTIPPPPGYIHKQSGQASSDGSSPVHVPVSPTMPLYVHPIQVQSAQSVVVPQRTNDEPLAPTVPALSTGFLTRNSSSGSNGTEPPPSTLGANPFETPATPTPPSGHLLSQSPDIMAEPPSSFSGSAGATGASAVLPKRDETAARRERRSNSTTQSRRYPIRGVDDLEERVSLWERPSPIDEDGDTGGQPGVRLVQPSRTGGRF